MASTRLLFVASAVLSLSTVARAAPWAWQFLNHNESSGTVELQPIKSSALGRGSDRTASLAAAVGARAPARVISVFGAEESGTKLVARMIANALGVAKYGEWDGAVAVRNSDGADDDGAGRRRPTIEVQHLRCVRACVVFSLRCSFGLIRMVATPRAAGARARGVRHPAA